MLPGLVINFFHVLVLDARSVAPVTIAFPTVGSMLRTGTGRKQRYYRVTVAAKLGATKDFTVIAGVAQDHDKNPVAIKCLTTGPGHPDGQRVGKLAVEHLELVRGAGSLRIFFVPCDYIMGVAVVLCCRFHR